MPRIEYDVPTEVEEQIIYDILDELHRAQSRYPKWPENIVMAAAIASEESGEVVKSVNNRYWQHGDDTILDIRKEAIQAAAMWVRFLLDTPTMNGTGDSQSAVKEMKFNWAGEPL